MSTKIYEAILNVMNDAPIIGKNRKNTIQGYSFRGIDDLYTEMHDILVKHKVFTVPEVLSEVHEERPTKSGGLSIYRILKVKYKFYTDDGSFIEAVVVGEAMDSSDKSSNKALSAAHKYALLQVFCIPTDEPKDSENDDHDLKANIINTTRTEVKKESLKLETAITDETKTKIANLVKHEFKGKDCLVRFLPDYNKKTGKTLLQKDLVSSEIIDPIIKFIEEIPAKV